jgi:anti-sigma factor RsiW
MLNRLFKSEHQRIGEMLSAYLDGELSPGEKTRVEKHLAQCAACAQNLRTLRQTVALLGQLAPVAVPCSFAIRPAQVAQRPSVFPARQTYAYLRAATVLATVLFAVVLAGDAFLTGLAPHLAPARAPQVVVREVPVEKAVAETVVVEKEVVVTVEVEKEVVVEKPVVETVVVEKEIAVEEEAAYEATPSPVPAEKKEELVLTEKPLPTEGGIGAAAPSDTPPPTPPVHGGVGGVAEATLRPDEERIEATAIPTPSPGEAIMAAEPALTPTALVKVLPPTPIPQEPTVQAAVHPSRLVLLRVVEASLLLLVLVLAIATLVVRRRQGAW